MDTFTNINENPIMNNNVVSEPGNHESFPISDYTQEEISLEDFEKLSGTSFIEFLRSQDDML